MWILKHDQRALGGKERVSPDWLKMTPPHFAIAGGWTIWPHIEGRLAVSFHTRFITLARNLPLPQTEIYARERIWCGACFMWTSRSGGEKPDVISRFQILLMEMVNQLGFSPMIPATVYVAFNSYNTMIFLPLHYFQIGWISWTRLVNVSAPEVMFECVRERFQIKEFGLCLWNLKTGG